jgi:molybdate transport repressor ModE-like protein
MWQVAAVTLSAHVPDLSALEVLLGVARSGSLNGAARQTGVSQQSVSARIRAMEAQTGVALVYRTPRGSTLTADGAVIAEWAARLLDVAAGLDAGIAALRQFASRDRFASWNGTAPLDASSGSQARHRLSRAGNRRINRILHIMAVVQLRNPTKDRAYYDERRADGMPSMMAMRALKRRLSNVVFARMLADQKRREASPGGHSHDQCPIGGMSGQCLGLMGREPWSVDHGPRRCGGTSRLRHASFVALSAADRLGRV